MNYRDLLERPIQEYRRICEVASLDPELNAASMASGLNFLKKNLNRQKGCELNVSPKLRRLIECIDNAIAPGKIKPHVCDELYVRLIKSFKNTFKQPIPASTRSLFNSLFFK